MEDNTIYARLHKTTNNSHFKADCLISLLVSTFSEDKQEASRHYKQQAFALILQSTGHTTRPLGKFVSWAHISSYTGEIIQCVSGVLLASHVDLQATFLLKCINEVWQVSGYPLISATLSVCVHVCVSVSLVDIQWEGKRKEDLVSKTGHELH